MFFERSDLVQTKGLSACLLLCMTTLSALIVSSPATHASTQPTQNITAECDELTVDLQNYPPTSNDQSLNAVTIEVDGEVVHMAEFDMSLTESIPLGDPLIPHEYAVVVETQSDNSFDQQSEEFAGTSSACEAPVEPDVVTITECGQYGSVTPAVTEGIVYTVEPEGAVEGEVTVTARYESEDEPIVTWTYDLGTYSDCPTEVIPVLPTLETTTTCETPGSLDFTETKAEGLHIFVNGELFTEEVYSGYGNVTVTFGVEEGTTIPANVDTTLEYFLGDEQACPAPTPTPEVEPSTEATSEAKAAPSPVDSPSIQEVQEAAAVPTAKTPATAVPKSATATPPVTAAEPSFFTGSIDGMPNMLRMGMIVTLVLFAIGMSILLFHLIKTPKTM